MTALTSNQLQTAACHQKTVFIHFYRFYSQYSEYQKIPQRYYKQLWMNYFTRYSSAHTQTPSRIIRNYLIQFLQDIGMTLHMVHDFTLCHTL